MNEFIIGPNEEGQRFDKYLAKLFKNMPNGLMHKQLRNKNITLNGQKANGNEITRNGDLVKVYMADETIAKFKGTDKASEPSDLADLSGKLQIVYLNDDILIADKPIGVLSQKAGCDDISMNEYLISYLTEKGLYTPDSEAFKPSFCNRLDRNTSGLMVAGITLAGLQKMSDIIRDRSIGKYYLAVVTGKISAPSLLDGYLIKDEKSNKVSVLNAEIPGSSHIVSSYKPLYTSEDFTVLEVKLCTGKSHQIRAHLASIGHPIIGDAKYGKVCVRNNSRCGGKSDMPIRHQLLHAYKLVMPEMDGRFKEVSYKIFMSRPPHEFDHFIKEIAEDKDIWQAED